MFQLSSVSDLFFYLISLSMTNVSLSKMNCSLPYSVCLKLTRSYLASNQTNVYLLDSIIPLGVTRPTLLLCFIQQISSASKKIQIPCQLIEKHFRRPKSNQLTPTKLEKVKIYNPNLIIRKKYHICKLYIKFYF